MKQLLLLITLLPLVYSLVPFLYYDGWVLFTNVENRQLIHIELNEDVDIRLPSVETVREHVYRLYLKNLYNGYITIDVFNSEGIQIFYKAFPNQGIGTKKIIQLRWDSEMLGVYHKDTKLYDVIDHKINNICHLAIYPHPTIRVNINGTYTFISNMKDACPDKDKELYLVCNLKTLPEKLIKNTTDGSSIQPIVKSVFYKSTNLVDNYIIRVALNTTETDPEAKDLDNSLKRRQNSHLTFIKNDKYQIKTPGYFLVGTNISLRTDFNDDLVLINNLDDNHPSILWREPDKNFHFEQFDYAVIQNLITNNTEFINGCQLHCTQSSS